MEEFYKILKPNGKLIIKVPHFSSRMAYFSPEHKHFFSSYWFDYFTKSNIETVAKTNVEFKILKKRFIWSPPEPKHGKNKGQIIINFFNSIISHLANLNIDFAERLWCYYVGGFGEIEFILESCKK